MRYRLWDKPDMQIEELNALDNDCWNEFSKTLLRRIPKVLYRYRTFNEYSLDELINGYAWFSNPIKFDDSIDSTVNTDIKNEMEEIRKSPNKAIVPLTQAIIRKQFRLIAGREPDEELIKDAVSLWPDGKLNVDALKCTLSSICPDVNPEPFVDMFVHFNSTAAMQNIEKLFKNQFDFYMSINKEIRSNLLCLCLAEEKDNEVMWSKYARERSGFCIGYEIPSSTFLGQKTLMALKPIYYGKRKSMRFFDMLIDGMNAEENDQINGWRKKTYEDINLSTLTKDRIWSFQKEWRVTFGPDAGSNKQPFPFIKSIYLGEEMDSLHRKAIAELANKKGWDLFESKLNKSGSKIIYQRIEKG